MMNVIMIIINFIIMIFHLLLISIEYCIVKPLLWSYHKLIIFRELRVTKKWKKHTNTFGGLNKDFTVRYENGSVFIKIKENQFVLSELEFEILIDYYTRLNKNYYDFKKG